MTTVYKLGNIVDNTIVGFYHCENGVQKIYNDETFNEDFKSSMCQHFNFHPTPNEEKFKTFLPGFHACACKSIEQLKNWFSNQIGNDILDILILNGCKLYSFKTEILFHGKSQICYQFDKVQNIRELNSNLLFK
jgi:hypothetical protein